MGSRKQTPSRTTARPPQGRSAPAKDNGRAKPLAKASPAAKTKRSTSKVTPSKASATKAAAAAPSTARAIKGAAAAPKAASNAKAELIRVAPKGPAPKKALAAPQKKSAKPQPAITLPHDAAKAPAITSSQSPAMKRNGQHLNGSSPALAAAPAARRSRKLASQSLPNGYRPSDAEPFMNDHQRLYFRNKLLQWKDDIIKQNRETLQILHDDTLQHADLADRATSEAERALELRARDRQRKLISKIDAALARIDDGSYGYCEETGEPISLKRLDARPIATLSLEAQERHERRERVYRED
jgi:DnaK suppressor protein